MSISPEACAELVAVKLCHDLAGPIGAINNGVEILQESDSDFYKDSLELVEMSAKEAVHKLMYFRQAYGTINKEGDVNIANLRELISNFFLQTKITLHWDIPEPAHDGTQAAISALSAKLLLNLLIIASSSLITGGEIKVTLKKELHHCHISIHAHGNVVKISDETLDLLTKSSFHFPITVKNIQAYLTSHDRQLA